MATTSERWFPQSPRWLLALLVGTATFVVFAYLDDAWTWTGAFVIGTLVGLDQGYDLSNRIDAYVRQFEWDKARVALRTLYFSVFLGVVLFFSSLDERVIGDERSLGVLLAVALGGGFIWAFMATATETPQQSESDAAPMEA